MSLNEIAFTAHVDDAGAGHKSASHQSANYKPLRHPTPEQLLQAADSLSETLAEGSAKADRERRLPFEAMQALRSTGLVGLRVPQEYGGAGGTWEDVARMVISLARGDSNVAQAFLSHIVFVERVLLMGSEEQRARLLPMASRGTLFGGAAAERGGPFRGEVTTRLSVDGTAFRLYGEKHYSTGALYADFLKIRALDTHGKLVAVLLPADSPGIQRIDDWDGMGQRLTASGTTVLKDVCVSSRDIMPMAPWMTRHHHTGAAAQIIHCAIEVGIALAALRDGVRGARQEEGGSSKPLFNRSFNPSFNPSIAREIGRLSARTHAAEELVLLAAKSLEKAAVARFTSAARHAEAVTPEADAIALEASILTAQAKIVSTETALDVTQALFDVGGAFAAAPENNLDRHWRNARTHTTHDPVSYKCRAVGNYLVNATPPPLTFSY